MSTSKEEEKELDFWKVYPGDCIEVLAIILIVTAIIDKPIPYLDVLKISVIVGALLFVARYVGDTCHENIRQGIHYGVSTMVLQQFVSGINI